MRFRLENRSGYDTNDLGRFFARGLQATNTKADGLRIVVVASPVRSRGCASVGGRQMVIAIAAPWRFSLRRLARMFEHECAHIRGVEHRMMERQLLYSLGPTPAWAEEVGAPRYLGRAPPQLPLLRRNSRS